MAKYRVIRTYQRNEYAHVEANSEEEAKEKAIENDCWEENPNDVFFNYDYVVEEDEDN